MRQKIARARDLRRRSTDAVRKLWRYLRNRMLGGYRFRRQVPLGKYIADFACMERLLIIELDGGQHAECTQEDEVRSAYLSRVDFKYCDFGTMMCCCGQK